MEPGSETRHRCCFFAMLSSTVLWRFPPQVQHFRVYKVYSHPLSHLVFTTTLGCPYLAFGSGEKQARRTDRLRCSGHFTLMSLESGSCDFLPHWASPDPREPPTSLALTRGLGPLGSKGVGSVSGRMGGPGRVRGKGRTRS